MSNAYEKYDYLDNQIVFLSQSINIAPWMPLLSWDSHNLGPGAKWGRVSSGSSCILPFIPPPLRLPHSAGGTEELRGKKKRARRGRRWQGPLRNEYRSCYEQDLPHSGRCKPSPTLKVSTLNFSKSMAAEFSTMMVTWASFRTVIGTTRKMPPGPTSRRLNLALAPWVTEFGGRHWGRWMRTETH